MDLKQIQEKLLNLLLVFDVFCQANGISYTLHGGTLLGAVREQGFIPWDDDADVGMTRENYNKLLDALKEDQGNYYIRGDLKKQFCIQGEEGIWVDIFICDYISEKRFLQNIKLSLLTMLDVMNRDEKTAKLSHLSRYNRFMQIAFKVLFIMGHALPRTAKVKMYTHVSEKWLLGNKSVLFRSNDQYSGRKRPFPADWMAEFLRASFEGHTLPILCKYDLLLKSCYGDTYMQAVRDDRNEQVHSMLRQEETIHL